MEAELYAVSGVAALLFRPEATLNPVNPEHPKPCRTP